jgi:hypothetical protein
MNDDAFSAAVTVASFLQVSARSICTYLRAVQTAKELLQTSAKRTHLQVIDRSDRTYRLREVPRTFAAAYPARNMALSSLTSTLSQITTFRSNLCLPRLRLLPLRTCRESVVVAKHYLLSGSREGLLVCKQSSQLVVYHATHVSTERSRPR